MNSVSIDDRAVIELARNLLEAKCADAAEPLWDLDDFGDPIYVDVGCATWVCCELFEIQDDPQPKVERDEDGITAIIQARVKWSHWDCTTIREFYVPIFLEDGEWIASASDLNWEDVSFEDVEEEDE